jgi:cyclic-di-GMP-binding protein
MEQRTPARKPPTKDSFDTRPAQIQDWIAGLPLANIGESSRLLFSALVETNSLDIPTEQRFRLLESFGTPVRILCEAMKVHFVGKPFPLTDRARQIVHLSQTLMTQMARGYRIVVHENADKRGLLNDNKQAAVACHRALSYFGETLLRAYQVYAPYPAGVWHQVHDLYRHAEAKDFARHSVKHPNADGGQETSIEDAYKRILLLALACPYRLRQGEVEQVYDWLREWSQHATLNTFAATKNPNGLFVADFASDDPPTYLVLHDTQYNQESCRLLNATRLADVVRDVSHQWQVQTRRTPKVNDQVLRRLMLAWGVMPKRRFSRSQRHSIAVVAMGLSAAHYYISGEVALEECENRPESDRLFSRPAHFEASDTGGRQAQAPDLWSITGSHPLRETHTVTHGHPYLEFAQLDENQTAPARHGAAPAYQTHMWKMINVSAGGYRLLWDSKEGTQAQVGELLGLRESADTDSFHLSLGVVRWMKHSQELGLELGVEMLSPGAVAVGTKTGKGGGEYMRSLLLPAVASIGQPATLLTPALPYHVGDVMIVNSHGKESRVELTKVVENTGTFAQYQFSPLDNQSVGSRVTADVDTTDFGDLWQKL